MIFERKTVQAIVKYVCLFLILGFLVNIFSSCKTAQEASVAETATPAAETPATETAVPATEAPEIQTDAALSAEKELEIKQAFLDIYCKGSGSGLDDLSIRFFGEFDGSDAVFVDGGFEYAAVDTRETVNGLEFRYPCYHKMLFYHDGEFLELTEAFRLGILAPSTLQKIYENYQNTYQSFYPERQIELEIKQAYLDVYCEGCGFHLADLRVRFFGEFNDSYAVFVDTPNDVAPTAVFETVDGLEFWYPSMQYMYIYHDGEFFRLTEAFELGLLTSSCVQKLYKNYNDSYLFGKYT